MQKVNNFGATPSMDKTFGCFARLQIITSLQYVYVKDSMLGPQSSRAWSGLRTFLISSIGSSLHTRSALTAKTALLSFASVHFQTSANPPFLSGRFPGMTSEEVIVYNSGRIPCDPHAFLNARMHRFCSSEPHSRLSVIYFRIDMSRTHRVGVSQ